MPYFGGKSGAGVFQTLINLMPPHEVYIEPFLGGGAVMRLKKAAPLNVGMDLSRDAIAAFVAAAGAIAEPVDEDLTAWTDDRGLAWQVQQGNGINYLEQLEYEGPGVLIYCDPPYLHSTRSSNARYAHELTDLEHRRLLRVLRSLKCNVMISGYSSPLYAKELKGWNATAFQAATRGAPAAEWVWYNFDKPTELHDYRFLGRDFRERERIHRQQRRWIRKLKALPRLERLALLSAMRDPG